MIDCLFGSGTTTLTEEKNAIWYTRLEKHEGRYSVPSMIGFINALQGTGLEHPHPDPLYPGDFDISAQGILFSANGLEAHRALLSKNQLYYIPVQTYTEDLPPPPHKMSLPNYDGIASSPTCSPDAKCAAFLQTKEPYEDFDQPRIFPMHDTETTWTISPRSPLLTPGIYSPCP